MLPIAMITGVLGYRLMGEVAHLMPYILFAMLFVTFCKLSPREMRLSPAHIWLLLIQLIGGGVVYLALRSFNPIVAQGALICVLAPTAISAAVITNMLGGRVAFLTTYILFSNVAVALCAPLIFPLIGDHIHRPFLESVFHICSEVGLLLLVPLILAWIVRYGIPSLHKQMLKVQSLSFYLWAVALTIVTGRTVKYLVEQKSPDYMVEISCAVVALVICVCQFLIGRRIGRHYGDPISLGQGLGQKNTILAIWMAQAYMNPISSIAPASYILWQNVINSYQLWLKNKRSETAK